MLESLSRTKPGEMLGPNAVLGFQRLLFARPGVLQVVGAATLVEIEPLSHNFMILTGRKTPLGCCWRALKKIAGFLTDFSPAEILLAILLANGAF